MQGAYDLLSKNTQMNDDVDNYYVQCCFWIALLGIVCLATCCSCISCGLGKKSHSGGVIMQLVNIVVQVSMAGALVGCASAAYESMDVKKTKIEQYSYLSACMDDYVKVDATLTDDINKSVTYLEQTQKMSYAIMGMDGCFVVFLILFIVSYNCKRNVNSGNVKDDSSCNSDAERKFLVKDAEKEMQHDSTPYAVKDPYQQQ
jgi:hypothetical protein